MDEGNTHEEWATGGMGNASGRRVGLG
jgi:hypothetical protein